MSVIILSIVVGSWNIGSPFFSKLEEFSVLFLMLCLSESGSRLFGHVWVLALLQILGGEVEWHPLLGVLLLLWWLVTRILILDSNKVVRV